MDKHQIALDILSDRVNFFDIFPRFYLYYTKLNHKDIYDMICDGSIIGNEEVLNKLNKSVEDYLNVIDKMKEKSNFVCEWVGCKDELGFFQEMMNENHFSFFLDTNISFFINENQKIIDNCGYKLSLFKLIGLNDEFINYLKNKY